MRVVALEATDFRNLQQVLVEPHPRFNVLSGANGQGKTNLLEAIYLIGTLRAFRAGRLDELLRFGCDTGRVRARVERQGTARLFEVELRRSPEGRTTSKVARVDGKPARAAQYFGGFNVVLFAPDDLRMPRGSPSGRRRFLDRAVWNATPQFLDEAQTYERVLKSRNALLRDGGPEQLLEVYDQQLIAAAEPLWRRRRAFVAALAPRVAATFARITGGASGGVAYESALEGNPAALAARLRAERAKDRARGATSSGPHADDLAIVFDGRDAGAFASQGQLRALVLALKIAEIELLAETLGDAPVLLLDDVSSELDEKRNEQLFEFLSGMAGQTFITTTHPRHVLIAENPVLRADFRVAAGALVL